MTLLREIWLHTASCELSLWKPANFLDNNSMQKSCRGCHPAQWYSAQSWPVVNRLILSHPISSHLISYHLIS